MKQWRCRIMMMRESDYSYTFFKFILMGHGEWLLYFDTVYKVWINKGIVKISYCIFVTKLRVLFMIPIDFEILFFM